MFNFTVPIKSPRQQPKLAFPESCLNCGQPQAGTRTLSLDVSSPKSENPVWLELSPPLCQECIQRENRVEWVSLIAFTVSGLFWAAVGFVLAWLILPDLSLWQFLGVAGMRLSSAVFVLAGLAALVAGVVGGTLVELGLRIFTLPYFGHVIVKRPLTVLGLFQERHDVIGMSARLSSDKKSLILTFEREAAAREFAALNNLPLDW